MTTRPSRDDGVDSPEYFAGWPGTPSTERLDRAFEYWRVENGAVMLYYMKLENDPRLRDIEMMSATMRNSSLVERLDQDRLEWIGRDGDLADLVDLLIEQESDSGFGCGLVIDDTPDTDEAPWLIAFRHLFALTRDLEWMGVSPKLPHLKDLHVHACESLTRPGRTGFLLGLPEKLMPANREAPGPVPEGEPQLLAEIAVFHGARSFRWMPPWMGLDRSSPTGVE